MSLFDHIKKKPDIKEEPKKNEPAVNIADSQEPDSAEPGNSDPEIASAKPENQLFGNMAAEDSPESASSPETDIKEASQDTAPLAAKRFSVGIDLGTTHCVL